MLFKVLVHQIAHVNLLAHLLAQAIILLFLIELWLLSLLPVPIYAVFRDNLRFVSVHHRFSYIITIVLDLLRFIDNNII